MNIEGGDPQSAVLLSLACHVTPRLSTMPNDLKDRRRVVRLGRAAVCGETLCEQQLSATNGRRAGGQVTFPPAASHRRLEGSNNHSGAEALPDRCSLTRLIERDQISSEGRKERKKDVGSS